MSEYSLLAFYHLINFSVFCFLSFGVFFIFWVSAGLLRVRLFNNIVFISSWTSSMLLNKMNERKTSARLLIFIYHQSEKQVFTKISYCTANFLFIESHLSIYSTILSVCILYTLTERISNIPRPRLKPQRNKAQKLSLGCQGPRPKILTLRSRPRPSIIGSNTESRHRPLIMSYSNKRTTPFSTSMQMCKIHNSK